MSDKNTANKYGVKVGDFFVSYWGYEQTNATFFQVIETVGKCSIRIREVKPEIIEENVKGMSASIIYNLDTKKLLEPASVSVLIKDQENGDLKRLKSYSADGISDPIIELKSYANAHHCTESTEKSDVSWYA